MHALVRITQHMAGLGQPMLHCIGPDAAAAAAAGATCSSCAAAAASHPAEGHGHVRLDHALQGLVVQRLDQRPRQEALRVGVQWGRR